MYWLILSNLGDAFSRHMRQSFSAQRQGIWIVAFVGVVVLWITIYLWEERGKKSRNRDDDDGGESLFHKLCKTHHLNQRQRALLLVAVERSELTEPAIAFVDPQVLLHLAAASPDDKQACLSLGHHLFGSTFKSD